MELSNAAIYTLGSITCFIVFVIVFKRRINALLSRATKMELKLTGIAIEAPIQEFQRMYETMYSKLLKKSHIELYCNVMETKGTPTVIEMIPDFDRQSEEWVKSEHGKEKLGMLRALRGLGFVEPKEGGKWKPEKHIVVTEFGREMYSHMKA